MLTQPKTLAEKALWLYFQVVCFFGLYLTITYPIRDQLNWIFLEGIKDLAWAIVIPIIAKTTLRGFRKLNNVFVLLYFIGYLTHVSLSLFTNPPETNFVTLAVYRNIFLYAILPFYSFIAITSSGKAHLIGKAVVSISIIQALIATVQYVNGTPSDYILSRYTGAAGGNMIGGGLLSYIEFSALQNIALALVLYKHTLSRKDTVVVAIIVVSILISDSRLGVGVAASLLLIRFPVWMFLATPILGIAIYLNYSQLNSIQHRIFSERMETSRSYLWTEALESIQSLIIRFQYGYWGGATSSSGYLSTAYLDSSLLSAFMQGGVVGLLFVVIPFVVLLISSDTNQSGIAAGSETQLFRGKSKVMLVFVCAIYSVFFNFIDGWPGNFLFWSIAGCIVGSNFDRSQSKHDYQGQHRLKSLPKPSL